VGWGKNLAEYPELFCNLDDNWQLNTVITLIHCCWYLPFF